MTNSLDKNPFVNIEAEIEASFKDEKLKKELKHHAYILTKSEQEAEDLVQEARHNVWRSR